MRKVSYLVSEIGESRDVTRFNIDQNDLQEAVTLYSFFKGNKKGFEKINSDKRCKLQPFSKFSENIEKNWVIDRWWTDTEKIELGILEESKAIQFEEFPFLLEEVSNNILNLKEDLVELVKGREKQYKTKKVKIGNIFDLSIKTNSSKFTKTFINKHKGSIPVYSASKFPKAVDYGNVKDNLKGIKYFENCLTWNIDGSIGKAHYRKGRFSLSEKVIPLIVKNELQDKLDINFLKNTIESEFAKHSFGFGNKAGKGKIRDIEILIPVDKNGDFDLFAQKEIAEKYRKVEDIKLAINLELDKISETNVDI